MTSTKTATMPAQNDAKIQSHLKTILEAYQGDVEAATKALLDLSAKNMRSARPAKDFSSAPIVVSLDNVSRTYKLGKNTVGAVQDISLNVHQGEFLAITGPSGSGKSTLLNLIGGLDRPDTGTVTVDGHDIAKLSDPKLSQFRNRTIGFVFQFFYLQPFLNVRTNLEVPAMFSHLSREDRDSRITELAEAVGITDRLAHLPRELSGGQMQRTAIARALINQPKIILADEPTGNVDRANAHAIMELFAKVRDLYGATVIIVTHDAEAARSADRSITIRDGKII